MTRCPWMGFEVMTRHDTRSRPISGRGAFGGSAMEGIVRSWGRILRGYRRRSRSKSPASARCAAPAATPTATIISAASITLREVRDFKGQALIDGVLALVDRHQPAARVDRRRRAAGALSRARRRCCRSLAERGIHVQVVTSAVRPDSRSSGPASRGCRSSSRSTACSPSTTSAARRPPTTASSSTSPDTRSSCTAR